MRSILSPSILAFLLNSSSLCVRLQPSSRGETITAIETADSPLPDSKLPPSLPNPQVLLGEEEGEGDSESSTLLQANDFLKKLGVGTGKDNAVVKERRSVKRVAKDLERLAETLCNRKGPPMHPAEDSEDALAEGSVLLITGSSAHDFFLLWMLVFQLHRLSARFRLNVLLLEPAETLLQEFRWVQFVVDSALRFVDQRPSEFPPVTEADSERRLFLSVKYFHSPQLQREGEDGEFDELSPFPSFSERSACASMGLRRGEGGCAHDLVILTTHFPQRVVQGGEETGTSAFRDRLESYGHWLIPKQGGLFLVQENPYLGLSNFFVGDWNTGIPDDERVKAVLHFLSSHLQEGGAAGVVVNLWDLTVQGDLNPHMVLPTTITGWRTNSDGLEHSLKLGAAVLHILYDNSGREGGEGSDSSVEFWDVHLPLKFFQQRLQTVARVASLYCSQRDPETFAEFFEGATGSPLPPTAAEQIELFVSREWKRLLEYRRSQPGGLSMRDAIHDKLDGDRGGGHMRAVRFFRHVCALELQKDQKAGEACAINEWLSNDNPSLQNALGFVTALLPFEMAARDLLAPAVVKEKEGEGDTGTTAQLFQESVTFAVLGERTHPSEKGSGGSSEGGGRKVESSWWVFERELASAEFLNMLYSLLQGHRDVKLDFCRGTGKEEGDNLRSLLKDGVDSIPGPAEFISDHRDSSSAQTLEGWRGPWIVLPLTLVNLYRLLQPR